MIGKDKKKLNRKDQDQTTALHYAVRYGHYNIVKMLVENGASKFLLIVFHRDHPFGTYTKLFQLWKTSSKTFTSALSDLFNGLISIQINC